MDRLKQIESFAAVATKGSLTNAALAAAVRLPRAATDANDSICFSLSMIFGVDYPHSGCESKAFIVLNRRRKIE